MDIPGEGWITGDSDFDDGLSLLDIVNIFGFLLDDPQKLGFASVGREPCVIATGSECDTFLRTSDSMRVWAHADTHLIDHWRAGSDSMSVEYNAAISPITRPLNFRNIDEEIREMMRANGVSGF